MSYLFDIIALVIIFCFVVSSAKRGFVRVLTELVGFIAVIVLTFAISTPLGNITYDKFIEPKLLESAAAESTQNVKSIVDSAWEALPSFITENAANYNLSRNDIDDSVASNIENGSQSAMKTASQDIIKPIAVKFLSVFYCIVISLILFIAVKFLAKGMNRLFSFSVAGKINKLLGGIVGFAKGIIFAAVFTLLILLIVSLTKNGLWLFTYESVTNSYTYKLLTGIIPFNIF